MLTEQLQRNHDLSLREVEELRRRYGGHFTAQRGLFTWHNEPWNSWVPDKKCHKWIIPSHRCFTLKLLLDAAGINAASLFPDLDGLGEHLGWRFKWQGAHGR